MATRMLQRRGTAAEWAAENPILASGEIGFETDTKILKLGDGVNAWNDLQAGYVQTGGGVMTGPLSLIDPTQSPHAATKGYVDDAVDTAPYLSNTVLWEEDQDGHAKSIRIRNTRITSDRLTVTANPTEWVFPVAFSGSTGLSPTGSALSTASRMVTFANLTTTKVDVYVFGDSGNFPASTNVYLQAIGPA